MYLNILNEEQKSLFLQLVYCAALSNGDYAEEQKQMMNSYCMETGMAFDETNAETNPEKIIVRICQISNAREKKIIAFEILGLILCDYEYDEEEQKFMNNLQGVFELSQEFMDKCVSLINDYLELQKEINIAVMG